MQAWLNPRDLPTPEQLTCGVSGRRLDFLMQVYAPPPPPHCEDAGQDAARVDSEEYDEGTNPDAFHRTIFLFISPKVRTVHSQPYCCLAEELTG